MPIECKLEFRKRDRISFQKLDYEVMHLAFESHNELGRNCEEPVYQCDLAARLSEWTAHEVHREVPVRVKHAGFVKDFRIDLAISTAIYELKATKAIHSEHVGQTLNYLHLTGCPHGKVVNFGTGSVESTFVNNPVPDDQRRRFEVALDHWTGPETLRTAVIDLANDLGLFLSISLYNQAILHQCGGPLHALERRPLKRGHRPLADQVFQICAPDEAFRITSLTTRLEAQRESFMKLISLSDLKAFHWINLHHHRIEFRSITATKFRHR